MFIANPLFPKPELRLQAQNFPQGFAIGYWHPEGRNPTLSVSGHHVHWFRVQGLGVHALQVKATSPYMVVYIRNSTNMALDWELKLF